jgi:hypothetical protein
VNCSTPPISPDSAAAEAAMSTNNNIASHKSGAPAAWVVMQQHLAECEPHEIIGIATAADFERRNEQIIKFAGVIDR